MIKHGKNGQSNGEHFWSKTRKMAIALGRSHAVDHAQPKEYL
jgi:hypothetical protein